MVWFSGRKRISDFLILRDLIWWFANPEISNRRTSVDG